MKATLDFSKITPLIIIFFSIVCLLHNTLSFNFSAVGGWFTAIVGWMLYYVYRKAPDGK